jgi:hypothetical protein
MGGTAVPAAVLLDTGADGYSYISADLAKQIPNSVRTPVNVITTSFTKSRKSSSESITFWLTLRDFPKPIFIRALIMPELQYDIILSAQALVKYELLDFLAQKLKTWYSKFQTDKWNHVGSVSAVQVISDDGEDCFGSSEAFPMEDKSNITSDIPHYEGPEKLQQGFTHLVD